MKIVAAVVVLLVSGGCAISDDYSVDYSGCMEEFRQVEQRWQKGPKSEVYIRGIDSMDYCANMARRTLAKYKRLGYLQGAVSESVQQDRSTGAG